MVCVWLNNDTSLNLRLGSFSTVLQRVTTMSAIDPKKLRSRRTGSSDSDSGPYLSLELGSMGGDGLHADGRSRLDSETDELACTWVFRWFPASRVSRTAVSQFVMNLDVFCMEFHECAAWRTPVTCEMSRAASLAVLIA